jgi:hypothetical protein
MEFTATVADRDYLRGHFILEDVEAANGMHRDHAWVNQAWEGFRHDLTLPCKVKIQAKYRRYRPGPNGWTICKIKSIEVMP